MMAYYDNKPSKLESVKNGSYIYRWNIERDEHFFGDESITQWKCDEVVIWAPLTSNKIISTVINELWDINYEQKLLNEYNAAKLNIYEDALNVVKIENYKKFLLTRQNVKTQIENDCLELNIK